MAIKISGTTIKMTRGDTLRVQIGLTDQDGNDYEPHEGDKIRFAMKASYSDPEPILIKDVSLDTLELVLNPEDTKDLPQPSSYVYDMELTYANGDVDTFIDKAKLMITEEVH